MRTLRVLILEVETYVFVLHHNMAYYQFVHGPFESQVYIELLELKEKSESL